MLVRNSNPPKVFVSYTHDSPKHTDRVLELSNRLRADGVDMVLDQYLDSPPSNWSLWAREQIEQVDFVLIICTENYYRHVMEKEPKDTSSEITWEAELISQYISEASTRDHKFIPVLFDFSDGAYIPDPINVMYYPVHTQQGYDALYRFLVGGSLVAGSTSRKLPQLEPKVRKQDFFKE